MENPFQNNLEQKPERKTETERVVRPLSPEEQEGLGKLVRKLRAESNRE